MNKTIHCTLQLQQVYEDDIQAIYVLSFSQSTMTAIQCEVGERKNRYLFHGHSFYRLSSHEGVHLSCEQSVSIKNINLHNQLFHLLSQKGDFR